MNKIILLLILAAFVNTSINAQTEKAETSSDTSKTTIEWKTITENDFEIQWPTDWSLDTSKLMGTRLILLSQKKNETDMFQENVNIIHQDLTGYGISLDDFVQISKDQMKQMITDLDIIQSEKQGDYHKIIFSGKQGVFNLKFQQRYFVINEKAYVLTFTTESTEYDAFKIKAEKILDSFQIRTE